MATAIEPDPSLAWQSAFAPDLATFEAIAAQAFATLPDAFRILCGDIEIRVAEMADDDVLDELSIEDPFLLMGLFEGIGLAQGGGEMQSGQMPNRVWLYRRAILDYWCGHDEPLGGIIAHVLIHELGHHFGLSDADMYALEVDSP
ncbi:metallopeptidase family protein [Stappia sp. ES.058]|uniref:metallopeptidase family protein n=1 Tax=Stappia sp. ES.058 TaxID=1881061 RepID=UPI00087B6395|nr:metallopeptidase family protein [Stappia sp. ES.058]SDU38253.1 Predicted Zn-dependent protease, minimal metalloprotease (MMP)-like domain [Stappia sp. ES.058]